MAEQTPHALRRSAKILGWLLFAGFELLILVLVYLVASVRCSTAGTGAWPQSSGEWIAFAIFGGLMLLLGAAVGLAGALATEGVLRLFGKVTGRYEIDP